jgi:hypothetical protein
MAFVVNDRVQEFTSTTGTGTLTLTGSPDGFETFSSAVGNGNTTYYTISSNTTEFEVGIGTVGAGTLSRDTVISSSNSDALVNFSAGTKNVFVTLPASKTILLNDSGTVDLTGNLDLNSNDITGTGNINITGNLTASGNLTSLGIDDNATSTAITINSSEQVEFTAGTALLPAITTTGDTNTGMWFPAADTIAFSEGGAEAMRIDSSGNVGIGTSTPSEKLVVERSGAGNVVRFTDGTYGVDVAVTSTGGSLQTGNINQTLDFKVYGNGYMGFYTSGTSERMRILSGGNVGIGTTTPDSLLSVNGVASFGDGTALLPSIANFGDLNTGMWFPAADTIAFSEGGAEAMRIDSSGNVGIGTSSPNNYAGYGNITLNGTSGGIFDLEVNGTRTGTLLALVTETRLSSITNIPLTFSTNNAERMRIDSSGNLGIGTSSPTFLNTTGSVSSKTIGLYNSGTATSQRAELQLGSAATASGNLTSGVLFGCGASDTTKNTLGSIFGIIDATSTTTASGALTFWTAATASGANTERMRIDSSGNLGIGTSSPDAKLSVNGVASFGDGTALLPSIANFGDLNTGMWFPAADTIAFSEGGAEAMRIDSSGRVGIGTSTPSEKLVVERSGAGNVVRFTDGTYGVDVAVTSTGGSLQTGNINQTLDFKVYGNGYMGFYTSGTSERMRINSGGNVGIGTTTPDAKLSVNGVASFGDGTALLPSIANFGDLNTGMWFPAADTIAFSEGGVEAMRIDSSGNVGIGTSTITGKLNIATATSDGVNTLFGANVSPTAAGMYVGFNDSDATATLGVYYASNPYPVINITRSDRTIKFMNDASERMRIDSSGNVGIGTSSPESLFHIESASSDPTLRITNKTVAAIDTGPDIEFWNNPFTATTVNSYESGAIRVRKTNGSNNNHDHYMSFWTRQNSPEGINERMRIDNSGHVIIGRTTTSSSTPGVHFSSNGQIVV